MAQDSGKDSAALSKPHMIAVVAMLAVSDEYRRRFVANSVEALKDLEIPVAPDARPVKVELPDKEALIEFLRSCLDDAGRTRNTQVIFPYICG